MISEKGDKHRNNSCSDEFNPHSAIGNPKCFVAPTEHKQKVCSEIGLIECVEIPL